MAVREAMRPGGRSARVQQAVHAAVRSFASKEVELSIPAIAAEEMSSGPGRAMIRDVLASTDTERNAGRCCAYTAVQIEELVDRAKARGERVPCADTVIDRVVAPIMYRILFAGQPISAEYRLSLVELVSPAF